MLRCMVGSVHPTGIPNTEDRVVGLACKGKVPVRRVISYSTAVGFVTTSFLHGLLAASSISVLTTVYLSTPASASECITSVTSTNTNVVSGVNATTGNALTSVATTSTSGNALTSATTTSTSGTAVTGITQNSGSALTSASISTTTDTGMKPTTYPDPSSFPASGDHIWFNSDFLRDFTSTGSGYTFNGYASYTPTQYVTGASLNTTSGSVLTSITPSTGTVLTGVTTTTTDGQFLTGVDTTSTSAGFVQGITPTFTSVVNSVTASSGGASSVLGGLACGDNATAGAATATAVGSNSHAAADGSSAFGNGAQALAVNSSAFGAGAQASGTGSSAFGQGAQATASNSSAFGQGAQATAAGATALGQGAVAGHVNATALGTGAATTRDNQMMFGTATSTYTAPGITSAASRAAQSGPVEVVTSDAQGNLATDGGAIMSQINQAFRRIDENTQGIAIALAMGGIYVPESKVVLDCGGLRHVRRRQRLRHADGRPIRPQYNRYRWCWLWH